MDKNKKIINSLLINRHIEFPENDEEAIAFFDELITTCSAMQLEYPENSFGYRSIRIFLSKQRRKLL